MKKRMLQLLSLLLLFCMAGSLFACQKEEEKPLEQGAFYTSCGKTYNTAVDMVITAQEFIAPLTSIEYQIYNSTDYELYLAPYEMGNDCDLLVEKFEGGVWVKAPVNNGQSRLINEGGRKCAAGDHIYGSITFSESEIDPETSIATGDKAYLPLTVGTYRMRQECVLMKGDEAASNPRFEAVAYFTVTEAPAQ